MTTTLFSSLVPGTCLYCGADPSDVVLPEGTLPEGTLAKTLALGVCDPCSYGLAHHWARTRGERPGLRAPRVVKTYLLVPFLPKGREPEDLSGYKFLVGEDGGLPWLHYVRDAEAAVSFLDREHGVRTWASMFRSVYHGYDGHGDFSEVLLDWSWGRSLLESSRGDRSLVFRTFAELLEGGLLDACFHLGVKEAFEGLLARRELSPSTMRLCVVLREPAMRYLTYQNYDSGRDPGEGHEDEDKDMVELCRSAMTSEELAVLALLEDCARSKAEERRDLKPEDVAPRVRDPKIRSRAVPADDDAGDEEDGEGGDEEAADEVIPEGFARPARTS